MLSFLLLSMNISAALFGVSTPAKTCAEPAGQVQMIGADKPVFLGRMVITATPLPR